MKKCRTCGDKFDPDESVSFEGLSEKMSDEIERKLEDGEHCFDCIWDAAFYDETMRDFEAGR